MKKLICMCLAVSFALTALSACGCDSDGDADLVFVNDSCATIVAGLTDFTDLGSVVQRADSCPMKRGESFGFEAGEYPVTVKVYDKPVEDLSGPVLAQLIIDEAPPEGERWYVTAHDSGKGLAFTVDTKWPEGA